MILLSIDLFSYLNVPKVSGSIINVPSPAYPTIQAGINAANPGDIVQVAAGTYYEHLVVKKSITLRGADRASIIDGQIVSPMILNVTVGNIKISGFTIRNGGNYAGIWVSSPTTKTNVNITGNTFINDGTSIFFSFVSYSNITNNIIRGGSHGILLHETRYSTIKGNDINATRQQAIEIYTRSESNVITNNTLTYNKYGILLDSSNNNELSLNTAASTSEYAIRLSYSTGTLIKENTLSKNKYGAYIWNCSGNTFYHNNFVENTFQVDKYDTDLKKNTWDTNKRPGTEGNYWSDYTGVDDGTGVGRWGESRVAHDGIGDTRIPHSQVAGVSWFGLDWYPLMHPWAPRPSIKPYAIFDYYPLEPFEGVIVTFNASKSYDRDGYIESYKWNFGDSTPIINVTDPITTHIFMNGTYTITLTVKDNDGNFNSTSKVLKVLPYRLVIDLYTQKEPYSGRGPNQPSDAFGPQEKVFLYAEVTYNYDPVANKPVGFVVTDPKGGTVLDRSNMTNEQGIAEINFTLTSDPSLFGIYFAVATVSVSEHTANDTLTFEVGWIIEIISVETADQFGNPKSSFAKGENIYFDIDVKNIAFTSKNTMLTISILDEQNVTIGTAYLQTEVTPGTHEFNLIFNVAIPEWSFAGTPWGARATACAFTNWPWLGGVPNCPEVTTPFSITRR
jgi:parallel beta-helix repeat protein